ncbi:MAG: hypothetical protein COV67_15005 [Nitrospinae bacterium CG11_big_fil_rev_8_21_14_0_20_56_8]|nr:MAG: hypothetical protein COV67_15005 [Nitrospinae bacterium CG11_big_fil_rev_8_21_14_0_20_56_8]
MSLGEFKPGMTWLVMGLLLGGLGLQISPAQADLKVIAFNLSDSRQGDLEIPQSSEISLLNDYAFAIRKIVILQHQSKKKLASIDELPAGENVRLTFTKAGAYSVCYFVENDTSSSQAHCLNINVQKPRMI